MLTTLKKATASCCSNESCDTAKKAGHKMREMVDAAEKDIHEVAEKAATEIRNKPLQAGALAVGAGFLLGLLMRRR